MTATAPRKALRRACCSILACVAALGAPSALSELTFEACELSGSQGRGRVAAECARLSVAEDPERPNGRQIELFLARVPALAPDPPADAFTIINGGPGASSVSLYVDMQAAFSAIHRERDIVLVDQRGTGRSAPLECPTLEAAAHEFEPAAIRRSTRACLADLEADPRFYTTSVAVTDLERVRQATGYERWNLYGVSYGTRVAQHYLQRFPEAVRSVVLDGVVPPDQALGPDIALNAQTTLDDLIARCASEDYCATAFPDLTGQFERLASRLQRAPQALRIAHPVTGRAEPFTLRYGHLAMTVRMLSYAPETAALIPLIIQEAALEENYLPLASQAMRLEHELGEAVSFGMHNTVVCAEDVPFYGNLEAVLPALEASYLGADQVRALRTICGIWPRGPVHPSLREGVTVDRPVLLLSGEHDPITPPGYAERAAASLPDSRHLVAPGQGHGVIARGCMPQLVDDFVSHGRLNAVDAECLARLTGDPFFVDLMGPPP